MRTAFILGVFVVAASLEAAEEPTPNSPLTYNIVERGGHHRVLERVEYEPAPDGRQIPRKVGYTEMATGLHYKNERGEWVESREEIEILPNGAGAVARQGQHKVYFAPDIAAVIDFETPDAKRLRSRVLGLSYFDTANGEAVLIGAIKSTEGELASPNRVVYPNAFDGIEADVEYIYTLAGFEQNIVLRAQLPAPDALGLNPETTILQVLTEFFDPPTPARQVSTRSSGLADETLSFGEMTMTPGRAFSVSEESETRSVPVSKRWITLDTSARTFLVEEVPLTTVESQINALPPKRRQASLDPGRRGKGDNVITALSGLIAKRTAPTPTAKMRMAMASEPRDGFVLDYTINLTSSTNFTFKGDTTHYVSGTVNLSGVTTIEGGAMIKFSTNTSAKISVLDSLICKTGAYRPAIFTAKDDNSVGETISGSTGNPGTSYYGAGIKLSGVGDSMNHARFSYLNSALNLSGDDAEFYGSDLQFIKCKAAITYVNLGDFGVALNLNNALFHKVETVLSGDLENKFRAQHITVHECGSFNAAKDTYIYLTNSLFVELTNFGPNSITIVITNQTEFTSTDAGIFQVASGGAHYLATSSPYRNIGTTNINAELLAALRQRTTYPPIAFTNTTSTYTALGPQAQRDTDIPDLGYHYDPLDYIFGKVDQNTNLTFAAGTAVGWFRHDSGWYHAGHGIHIADNKTLTFAGQVTSPCYFVHQTAVQENLIGYTPFGDGAGGITGWATSKANQPYVNLQFTRFAGLPIYRNHIRDDNGAIMVTANHCEFYGGGLGGYVSSLAFTNCLLDRTGTWLSAGNTNYNDVFAFRNCTVRGGYFAIARQSGNIGHVKVTVLDSAFELTDLYPPDPHSANASLTHYDYNAYLSGGETNLPSGAHDFIVTNFNWQTGWYGDVYLPTNSPLINAGSVTNAALLGLYHFTVTTNQVKEATSTLDIGYHYVATDGSGAPVDTDGDNIPDYLDPIPWVQITSPANGTLYAASPTNILITANAHDDGYVTKVEFYSGNTKIGEDTTEPYSLTWSNVGAGFYSLTARATDNSATISTSAVVNVAVTALITQGATWKYLDNGSNQGTNWREPSFNDSAWAGGSAELGYGDNDEATTVNDGPDNNRYVTTYFRKTFVAQNAAAFSNIVLRLLRDDGAVVYVNGVEVRRDNLPGGTITYSTLASSNIAGANEDAFYPFLIEPSLFVSGTNVIAVEIHQNSTTSVDISFNLELAGNLNPCYPAMDVALVLDRSSSMAGQPLQDAKQAATNFISFLQFSVDQAAVVSFASNSTLHQTLTNHSPTLVQAINSITNLSDSRIDLGIKTGQQELDSIRQNPNALPVMLLLSDGKPDGGISNVLYEATQAKNAGTRIITIGFGSVNTANLQAIASSPSDYYYAADSSQLPFFFEFIAASLCRDSTNQIPSINLTNPINGQLFVFSPTNILLQATASDSDGTVTNVAFFNGTSLLANDTEAPYEFLWENVTWASNYTVKAVATDNLGASATNSMTITVNAMPTVTITSPTNLQSFLEVTNITISATATDSDGSMTNVAFYSGTNFLGNDASSPYSLVWNNRTNNFYPVHAIATDNRGASTASEIRVFEVTPTNTFPSVTISFPTNTMNFAAGSDITITASVTPGSGTVTNVEFFVDDRLLGNDANAPYSLTECCWKAGQYVLRAKAADILGEIAVSARVEITVGDPVPTSSNGHWDPAFDFIGAVRGVIRSVATDKNGFLYAGGCGPDFATATGPIAKWTGTNWLDLHLQDSGDPEVHIIKEIGDKMWVGGQFANVDAQAQYIAAWDGTDWLPKGDQLNGAVYAIATIGSDVYIGGKFTQAGTNTSVQYVAKLIGTNWMPVGNGLTVTNGVGVRALASIGNELYIGGDFTAGGGSTNIQYIAKLAGTNWVALGSSVNGPVRTLAVCGQEVFAGGDFTTAGGNTNANCIAKWELGSWTALGSGMSGPATNEAFSGCSETIPPLSVHTIVLRGYDVFAGGKFRTVRNGTNELIVNHIAQATWSRFDQSWTWSAMEGGVTNLNSTEGQYVHSAVVRQDSSTNGFEVFIGGCFGRAGNKPSQRVARWTVGLANNPRPDAPVISISSPTNSASFTDPSSISISATATGVLSITSVEFFVNGQSLGLGSGSEPTYTIDWNSPSNGVHVLTALAIGNDGIQLPQSTLSSPVYIQVKSTNAPIANDDQFTVGINYPPTPLNVLTNDTASGTNTLRVTEVVKPMLSGGGTMRVGYNGQNVVYTPSPDTFGTDVYYYTITDSQGNTASARITIEVQARPEVSITSPYDEYTTNSPAGLTVTGNSFSYSRPVTNVALYVNNVFVGQTTNNAFSFNWSTNSPNFYTFKAVATDAVGVTNTSLPVTVVLTNTSVNNDLPVAVISNLLNSVTSVNGLAVTDYAVIREGLFNLKGQARDPDVGDPVAYQVQLCVAGNPDTLVANVTPGPLNAQGFHNGGDTNGDLGWLDLTLLTNGVYDLKLTVHGGGDSVSTTVRVSLDTQLKIGQFSFNEQDLVIPVNGIPITVVRTYNSLNPHSGDFGPSWSFAINSMDVQLDESRQNVTAGSDEVPYADEEEDDYGRFREISIRTGGSRDVTLTLPDGRRTTFLFKPKFRLADCQADARWEAPPGVTETLTVLDSGVINLVPTWDPFWQDGGKNSTFDNHDIKGWMLKTLDDTKFYITRGEANNIIWDDSGDGSGHFIPVKTYNAQPKLEWIEQRSGDLLHITDEGIAHYANGSQDPTRSVFIERDTIGRISAIRDPNSGSNGLPVVKYAYNRNTGNLIEVHRLQNRSAGTYSTNKYHYDHPKFPHYITSIEDPRGIPLARNEYDDSGRLTAVVDADGQRTEFEHNITGKLERVIDRLGFTNTFVYDLRGNVTATTNALGQITTMAYDDFNNKTNDVGFLDSQPYATNNYLFSTNLLLASINALGHSNTFTYGPRGRLETSTDARGFSSTNYYNNDTDLLIATSDALGNVTSNYYDLTGNRLLLGTRDAIGTLTTNKYDALGNLLGAMTYVGSTILSTNTYAYDLNGNQTNSVAWRRVNGVWTGATNTTIYDAQNRVVQTIASDGGTNTMVYNALGKQDYTVDALGRTNRFAYDAQGRLFQTIYPDGSTNLSYFDAEGRTTNSVDRAGRGTTNYYDALGRVSHTVYADNTTNRTVYDGLGQVAYSVDARGVTNAFGYDVLGRQIAVTNAWGTTVAMTNIFGYDVNGNQPYVTNALGVVTTNYFDALNRVTNVLHADGTKMFSGYDAIGRRVAETNQDNIVTRFGYDGAGRLVAVTNAFGVSGQQTVTRYEHDEAGNQTAQIDALNRTNRCAYDNMGRRISHTMPDTTRVEAFGYDITGNLIRHTNFNSVVITNQYDVLNRLTNRSSVNGYSISYAYSVTGQRTNMADLSGTTAYTYDIRDRLTNKVMTWTGTGGPTIALSYCYDANGNLTNLWSGTSSGVTNFYQYDPLSRLTNVLGRDSVSAGYTFDGVGNLQTVRYGSGVTNLYQYDRLNRLTNTIWKLNTSTLGSFYYKLGLAGMRTNLDETLNGTRSYAWQYDARYRLTNENISAIGSLGYGYDPVGNRTNRTSGVSGLGNQTPTYNTNDWLTTDTYDNNGNTTASSGATYQYDVENRLTNVNSGAMLIAYDGDGNRVKKTVGTTTTYYLVDDRNPSGYAQVMEEHQSISGGAATLTAVYTYGLDLITQRRSGNVRYFCYDGHGSTRLLTDTSGSLTDTYLYDAYGTKLSASTGSTPNNYLYCGEQFDSDLGSYYLRARYYKPDTGRFWTSDSHPGNNQDPLSLHRYLYAHANPVSGVDPSGNFTQMEMVGSLAPRSQMQSMTMGTLNTGRANLMGKLITLAQVAAVALPFALEHIAEQAISASTVTAVQPTVEEMLKRDKGKYRYFFHATANGDWIINGTAFDSNRSRRGDFGAGFYMYRLDVASTLQRGFDLINSRVESGREISTKVIGIYRIRSDVYAALGKEYVIENYIPTVNACRRGQKKLFNTDVVIGATAKIGSSGYWVPNPDLPTQYKFESPQAIGKLELVLPIIVP